MGVRAVTPQPIRSPSRLVPALQKRSTGKGGSGILHDPDCDARGQDADTLNRATRSAV